MGNSSTETLKKENSKSIDVLNDLLQINNDRIEGYQTASDETTDASLKSLFSGFIATSQRAKSQLTQEIVGLGGEPIEGTRVTGKFFRAWMDVKAAFTGNDKKTILNSCEQGEDVAVHTYEDVIEKNISDLSTEHQTLIKTQYTALKADHDSVKALRNATN